MSGRSRNLIHGEKIVLPFSRLLPEVIRESPTNSPGKNFGEEISSDVIEKMSFKTRLNYNSTTSSAQSQRFQDMFYKTDWPSLSDTGTDSPDCIELEGSDSSASSMFSWADAEGTKMVAEEWEKIQRTLYNEPGPKVTQKHLIEECNQWKTIYPHIRVVGRGFGNSSLDYEDPYDTEEEVLALHYDSDVDLKEVLEAPYNNIMNEKFNQDSKNQKVISQRPKKKSAKELGVPENFSANTARSKSGISLVEELDTLLQITPMAQNLNNNNYPYGNRSSAIIKSEITSSRWRQRNNVSPDFVSLPHQTFLANKTQTRDNSAASLFSLAGARKYLNSIPNTHPSDISRNKSSYKRQTSGKRSKVNMSDKHSHLLEPLEPILPNRTISNRSVSIPLGNESIKSASQKNRNVSLPPILADENTNRKKHLPDITTFSGKSSRRNNKTTLTPIQMISGNIPKHNIGGDADTLSLFNDRSIFSNGKKTSRRRSSKKYLPSE